MKSLILTVILSGGILISCSTSIEPPNGTVDFYISNSTGSSMTLSVYDKVCRRTFFRVSLPRSREVPLTTCAATDGRADIRYRRRAYKADDDNPWLDSRVASNQVLVVR